MFFLESFKFVVFDIRSNRKKEKGIALHTSRQKSIKFPKGTSLGTFFSKYFFIKQKRGSITIEASLALPLFLFFVINLLSIFDVLAVHIQLESALHQTAREMAVYGYAIDKIDEKEMLSSTLGSVAFSETYVRNQVNKLIGKDYLNNSCIKGGSSGIIYSFSKFMENDRIELKAVYKVEPKIPYIGFQGFYMVTGCTVRAFTGYDNTEAVAGENAEQIVYITETGNVYHFSRNCTHLELSISRVDYKGIKKLRNEAGEKYKACEKCGKKPQSTVYITNEGNRYHTTVTCSGLKRTIEAIPISKVGNKSPCSRCGGS